MIDGEDLSSKSGSALARLAEQAAPAKTPIDRLHLAIRDARTKAARLAVESTYPDADTDLGQALGYLDGLVAALELLEGK